MKTITKLTLATSILAISLSGTSAMANAGPVAKSNDDLSLRIKKLEDRAVMSDTKKILLSGHVNRAMQWLSNGDKSNIAHVDNDNSASRLNLTGVANFNDDMVFGGTFETAFKQNTSDENDVRAAQSNSASEAEFRVRIAELFMDSKKLGKLTMGRGSMASDNTMEETDLSGTSVVANGANVWQMAGGASFFEKTSGTNQRYFVAGDNETFFGVFDDVDGLSRHDRVRYDTPKYYGFGLSASHAYQSSGNLYDVAARFAGKFSGIKVASAVAYSSNESITDSNYKQINGSVGVLFPVSMSHKENTGINLFFGAAKRDWKAAGVSGGKFYHAKIGYIDQYFSIGNTAIAVDFADSKDMVRSSDDGFNNFVTDVRQRGKSWGVFLVQNVDVVATELYAGYRNFSYKRTGNTTLRFNDINAVMAGARVKL